MEHYSKSSLCPLKYYIGGSVFYEFALEIWKFCVCFFFIRGSHHSPPSTQQLCLVEAEMQSVILACTHLQMQALTSAAMRTVTETTAASEKGHVF